ncbi:MAG: DNA-binding GntR family transcriptional regulator [Lysobacterales bacterium]
MIPASIPTNDIERAPVRSLAERAYLDLEEMLVTLQLKPGQLLQEKDLAHAVGIGRTPVREAVQKLAGCGLLIVLPRKGLMVAPVLRSELSKIIEARRVLERLLVVKASERADSDQRGALESLATHIEQSSEDLSSFLRLDRRLDELLEQACGNQYLVQALSPMHAHCRRLWYLNRQRLDLSESASLHAGLARSVAHSDGSGAIRSLNGIISALEDQVGSLDAIS